MKPSRDSYDVIVMGGGPAGSTAATLLAQHGRSVLLLDRESFPRFRVGESLMPATYWTLRRLGVIERMHASSFPRKHSVQFFAADGSSSAPFYFSEFDPHESSVTWQVDRVEFDRMLLDHASRSGVEVCQRANVREVLFDDGQAKGVRVEIAGHGRMEIASRVVVDATGQAAFLAKQLGLQEIDPKLRHASFHTRFRGAVRDCGIDEGATLIMQTAGGDSWFWFIPLPENLVSVGVVGPFDYLVQGRASEPTTVFDEEVAKCPGLQKRIDAAEQVGEVRVIRDFSYISKRIAGDGWVLAGDAFGFLDPIYSTGVFLGLKSAEWAADSIQDAFDKDDFSAAVLGSHGDRFLAGMEDMRKLVYAYYDRSFSIPRFLKRYPQYREQIVNLLIGNVFSAPMDGLFEEMGRECELPESRKLLSGGESP